jgi:hypothetical protein
MGSKAMAITQQLVAVPSMSSSSSSQASSSGFFPRASFAPMAHTLVSASIRGQQSRSASLPKLRSSFCGNIICGHRLGLGELALPSDQNGTRKRGFQVRAANPEPESVIPPEGDGIAIPEIPIEPETQTQLAKTLQMGSLFGLWYLFNIYFNIYNKQVRRLPSRFSSSSSVVLISASSSFEHLCSLLNWECKNFLFTRHQFLSYLLTSNSLSFNLFCDADDIAANIVGKLSSLINRVRVEVVF